MKQITIKSFNGGVSDNLRDNSSNKFGIAKHFDIYQDSHKLIPLRDLEADDTNVKTTNLTDFVLASDLKFYGCGQKPTTLLTKFYRKNSAPTDSWTELANEGDAAFFPGCLIEYKSFLFGFQTNEKVFKFDISAGTFTYPITVGANITSVANGIIAKDDNLYLAYNNIIIRINSSFTGTDNVLTLPSNLKITSLENYGNYLAIACSPIVGVGKSFVYLWDLVSDDVSESIDWGFGDLKVIGNLEGAIIGVSSYIADNSLALDGSILIKYYGGGLPKLLKKIKTDIVAQPVKIYKFVRNNILYFIANSKDSFGEVNCGIWSFGRKNANEEMALNCQYTVEGNTSNVIGGFGFFYDYIYINHSGDGSISRTNDAASYTYTSIYESQELTDDDYKVINPKILAVYFDKLPTAGQIVAKFRKDGATSWTTLFTHTTDSSTYKEYSFNVPAKCNYCQIRLESTGGAVATGYKFQYEPMNTMI